MIFFIVGALLISSGLVLNVCVAAMLIMKSDSKSSVREKKEQARKDFAILKLKGKTKHGSC